MSSRESDAELELVRVIDGIAESLLTASDEEILEEARQAGEDPEAIAREQRSLLLSIVRKHRKEKLAKARRDYEEQTSRMRDQTYDLPGTAEARLDLLIAALNSQPGLEAALTLQHREFRKISDEDVQSYLRQLDELGVLDELKRADGED